MRLRDDPARQVWGAERITTAYLAAILSLIGAGLVALVAYPIITATAMCANDQTGVCQILAVGAAAGLGGWASLAWLSGLFGLGLAWAGWMALLQLVTFQLVLSTNQFRWLIALLLVPVLAAAASASDRSGRVPPAWRWIRLGLAGAVAAQWTIWLIWLLTGAP
ncbi:MAG: hypothetical protein LBJ44_10500 [Propionibacteriaceae bacterium]|nr:hypothetical protein [Propionibacteriaceae bacterium]